MFSGKYTSPLLLGALLMFLSPQAFASDTKNMYECSPSIEINSRDTYPGSTNIPTSNNLRRMPGSIYWADGQKIYISGRIVDENCIPVQNAKVQIWHANAKGYFKSDLMTQEHEDEHFAGSGETFTNNLGEYTFLTIFPGKPEGSEHSFINVAANHEKLGTVRTRMYLIDQTIHTNKNNSTTQNKSSQPEALNNKQKSNNSLPPDVLKNIKSNDLEGRYSGLVAKRKFLKGTPTFLFNITLPKAQQFRIF